MKGLFKIIIAFFFVLLMMLTGAMIYRYFDNKDEEAKMEYNSDLIQNQFKNVSKLIVTEAKFSQVMTYEDQQKYLMDLVSFKKKAVVIINADATVSYDMSQIAYELDEVNKVVRITNLPKEEIKLYPEIKLYDVEQSKFNPFQGEDYNKINTKVKEDLLRKIEGSTLKANAQNRLITELSKILIVTQSLGWKLEYQDTVIDSEMDFNTKVLF
ncbi:DUF4230 domain-containing protein [Flavobacterium sp. NKUCC04_CG]|uniref:DUF4230 domain-containing protein n=1 Tax=Flavobacterium sp. NKUCC04_CG TaxID=2842121 RepID=UPI001C5B0362|nr:DUF4230 domain-containing protein [Flavobacterium sp. NKUCC04_CG]MBW3517748.1 DUF4230 domain-containing protein [Flavobacterium sp. NKUCC04_CG]